MTHPRSGPAIYDTIGRTYTAGRRTEPHWAAVIEHWLGEAQTVVNVGAGAGAGSYEPAGRRVLAVEPSITMIAQRPTTAAPVVRGDALSLPLTDKSADAGLAILTIHHWPDWRAGLREMARVTNRIAVLTYDMSILAEFWLLRDYLPEVAEFDRSRVAPPTDVADALGGGRIIPLPVPADMVDGVLPAYWCRPSAYLNPVVLANCSGTAQSDPEVINRGIERLSRDLSSGTWAERNADLVDRTELDVGFCLVTSAEAVG